MALSVVIAADDDGDGFDVELRENGWLEAWTEDGAGGAVGSVSQLKREPKGKCWTTGNLERTSALYILIMPFGA